MAIIGLWAGGWRRAGRAGPRTLMMLSCSAAGRLEEERRQVAKPQTKNRSISAGFRGSSRTRPAGQDQSLTTPLLVGGRMPQTHLRGTTWQVAAAALLAVDQAPWPVRISVADLAARLRETAVGNRSRNTDHERLMLGWTWEDAGVGQSTGQRHACRHGLRL